MPDGRKNNGGHKTAGRKSKAEEFKLIDKLDSLINPDFAIEKMFEHMSNGSEKMLELYMGYRFGKPKQQTDITTNGDSITDIPLINWVDNKQKGVDFMDNFDFNE